MPGPARATPAAALAGAASAADAVIADFDAETRNAGEVQKEVLRQILERNARTEYLQNCGLNGRTDPQSFKSCVPIITHSDLKPYFDRIVAGDRSPVLTADPIQTLSLSSGTTSDGQQKYLVLYKEILEATVKLARIASAYRSKVYPIRPGGKILDLVFSGKVTTTSGGLRSGTATTHLFRSKEFKLKHKTAAVKTCSPDEVIRASNNWEAMYCHLLCALLARDEIESINSTFAYTIVEAFKTFETQWPNLCNDIRHGEVSSDIVTEASVREAMAEKLRRPDPALADVLTEICTSATSVGWFGIISKLWPNCKYILSIMTGAMEPYLAKLRHYAGDVPFVCADYGSTESWIGVNASPKVDPKDATFTVVPTFAYFEFIPQPRSVRSRVSDVNYSSDSDQEEVSSSEPEPVSLTEVEVGREYELIMTTYGGLYRYRLGDIVRVTSFFNSTPQLAYVCRKNVLLTVNIDKNTEKELQIAVNKAMDVLQEEEPNAELVDYTSYANLCSSPGHYVVFWEVNVRGGNNRGAGRLEAALEKCATAMDEAFLDPGYVGSRKINTIGSLELCLVESGTFGSMLERYLRRSNAAITQYKTPRCLPSDELRAMLRSRVVCSTFSTAYSRRA